jgi:hypothetical protein
MNLEGETTDMYCGNCGQQISEQDKFCGTSFNK